MAAYPVMLDWTAERLRAWTIAPHAMPRALALDGNETALLLVVSMADRKLQVGKVAHSLIRQQPHVVVERFLPYVGTERWWQHGRHSLDAREVLAFVLGKIKDKLQSKSLFHVVPSYWNREQAALLEDQTRLAGYRSLGVVKRGVALAGQSSGVTIDVDSHAVSITLTRQQARSGGLQLEQAQIVTDLALPIWSERVAALVASRCLRDCRRDPRAHPVTDQQLHEQILERLYDWASQQDARIELKHQDWQDDVLIQVADVLSVCMPLAQRLAQNIVHKQDVEGWYFSPEATRLPGVPHALYQGSSNQRSLSVLPLELMPQTLTNWVCQIDKGLSSPPQTTDVMPLVSEMKVDPQPDTLPFQKRTGKR